MSVSLLLLPGELRNMIYKFALFEEKGLDYSEDSRGLGWLCVQREQTGTNNSGHAGRERNPCEIVREPLDKFSKYTVCDGRVIANQLQFVCRQLHCETKALAVCYNTINFRGLNPTATSTFLETTPTHIHGCIRALVLWPEDIGEELELPSDVISFCRKQPQCTLSFHHPMISSSTATRLLFTAFLLKHEARRDMTFVQKLSEAVHMQNRLLRLLKLKVAEEPVAPLPPNIVFYPCDKFFDEAAFRESCLNSSITRMLIPTLRNGIDDLVIVAKECFEYGF